MHDHPSGNVRFVISTLNAVDDDEDEENADTRRGKRQRKDLVGDGGVEGRAGGAVGGGEGFKRRMTSVGRSVGELQRGTRGKSRHARGGDQYFATTPRLRHHLSLALRCERAKLDSLSYVTSQKEESSGQRTSITLDFDGSEL